jgi:hypothetical protein
MPKFSLEISILIGIIVGLIIPFIGIGSIFSIMIVGFVATYLIEPEKTSSKVGAMAAMALGFLLFLISFITTPSLPYQLPNPLTLGGFVVVEGFLYIVLGLIVTLIIYGVFGFIGGYIAVSLFKAPKKKAPQKRQAPQKQLKKQTLKRKSGYL